VIHLFHPEAAVEFEEAVHYFSSPGRKAKRKQKNQQEKGGQGVLNLE